MSRGGTLSSVCSCVVCSNEYSSGNNNNNKGPHTKNSIKHPADSQVRRSWQLGLNLILTILSQSQSTGPVQEEAEEEGGEGGQDPHHHHQLVETPCDNEKCIMCTPVPQSQPRPRQHHPANNNNYHPEENNQLQSNLHQLPPPLPAKTVAPYQVKSHSVWGQQLTMSWTAGQKFQQLSALKHFILHPSSNQNSPNVFLRCQIPKYVGIQVWTRGTNAKYGREQPSCERQEEEEASNKKDGTVN